jgi:hypothetical protein
MKPNNFRKYRNRFVLLLILFSAKLFACDICGAYIGVLPNDNKSSISFSHRYRLFSGYVSGQGNYFPSGAYRIPQPATSILHGAMPLDIDSIKDYESFKVMEIRAKWFFHPKFELNLVLPWQQNRNSTGDDKNRIGGMGDISLMIGWHIFVRQSADDRFRQRIVAGLGVKLPTGKCAYDDADGNRYHLMFQIGSGSTDAISYLVYTGAFTRFRWGTNLSFRYSGMNKYHEQLSASESAQLFLGYGFDAGKCTVLPQLQVYQEYMSNQTTNSIIVPSTGMNNSLIGPACAIFYEGFSMELAAQMPVYDLQVESLRNKYRFVANLAWNFQQNNYLLKQKN